MGALYANLINGEWIESPDANRNINPSDLEDVVGEYARADAAQARRAVAAAGAAFPAWARGNIQERADLLDRILDLLPEGHQAMLRPIVREAPICRSGATEPEYSRLFGVGLAATPYETEYDPLASARKGHRLADLLGFYEAFGVRLADHRKEFPDHIAAELEFMAILLVCRAKPAGCCE